MRLTNNHWVRAAFVASQQGFFPVSVSRLCSFLGFASCLEVCSLDVHARWLVATQTSAFHLSFMNVDELKKPSVQNYSDDDLAKVHWYNHTISDRLRLIIGVVDLRILKNESAVAACEQLRRSLISNYRALHKPLEEFVFSFLCRAVFSSYRQGHLSRPYLSFFFGALQDPSNGSGGLRCRPRFCKAVWIEVALRVTKGLAGKFPARKCVLLRDEQITADPPLSWPNSKVIPVAEPFTRNPTVWIHRNIFSSPGSSFTINARLRSQPPKPSSKQMQ